VFACEQAFGVVRWFVVAVVVGLACGPNLCAQLSQLLPRQHDNHSCLRVFAREGSFITLLAMQALQKNRELTVTHDNFLGGRKL
jgi:hypothetical protein